MVTEEETGFNHASQSLPKQPRTLTCRSQTGGAGLAASKISEPNSSELQNTETEERPKTAIYKETFLVTFQPLLHAV